MKRTTLKQLTELPDLSTAQLKEKWRVLFGNEPPQYNRPFLIKRLAYRVQELAYGGLSEQTRQKLNDVLEATGHDDIATPRKPAPTPPKRKVNPIAGTRFIRDWNGQRIEVLAVDNGFEYDGRMYRSLSAIAREVTGANWNGPAFFGLRGKKNNSKTRGES
jgi:hypothetical protein